MAFNIAKHSALFGLTRRQFFNQAAVGMIAISIPLSTDRSASPLNKNLNDICSLPSLPLADEPLLALSGYQRGEGKDFKQRVLTDLSENPGLVGRIEAELGSFRQIKVVVEQAEYRQLYVPELRRKYRRAYEWYCTSVIDYLSVRMACPNFYGQILSPLDSFPTFQEGQNTALLVHQLGWEYRLQCCFSADSGTSKRYLFTGANFSEKLGGVEVVIENSREEEFTIQRNKVTIWQNSSRNLYSLYLLPLEETLHYQLGAYTDARISAALSQERSTTVGRARRLAQEWMAVEEALVGGLADLLLKEYLFRYDMPIPRKERRYLLDTQKRLPRYKYRAAGIRLASHLGFQRTLDLYKADPKVFAKQLAA